MLTILFCVLSLISIPVAVWAVLWAAAWVERVRKHEFEREFGFWDANVLAALDGSAIQ